jgi:MIP family channel proteins
MHGISRAVAAELLGTFTLVFIGAGAGALAGINGGGILAVALAHGTALVTIAYTWGPVSGAHVNPAVTLALAVMGKISWNKAVPYWIAQFVGAALAGYVLLFLVGDAGGLGATTGTLTHVDSLRTIVVEAVLTFFLMSTILGTAVAGRGGNAVGLAIGFVLVMDILMGGALTGASMNPARTFGPALATGDMSYMWMYLVGPCVGALAAALGCGRIVLSETER